MMIELQQVSKRYTNGYVAIDNVSLHISSGEFVFLTGHTGAGKSTLLKLIATIEPVTNGDILLANQSIKKLSARQQPLIRRKIGLILQTPHLLLDRTVFDNVALPLLIAGYSYKEAQNRVRAILTKVGLQQQSSCYTHALSNGEQQRVAIARAVINKPPLLLADEPTDNLDPALANEIMQLFAQFNRLGMTILIATNQTQLIDNPRYKQFTLAQGRLIHETATA